jgi:acetoacetyl-CoA synthetase
MSRYRKHANICTMNSQKTSLEKTADVSQKPLWAPSQEQIESTTLYLFMQALGAKKGVKFVDYDGLWRWSVEHSEQFWDFLWDFCDVQGDKGGKILDSHGGKMLGAQFFPEGKINYAENNLRQRDSVTAIIFRNEQGEESSLTYATLYDQVSPLAAGVHP